MVNRLVQRGAKGKPRIACPHIFPCLLSAAIHHKVASKQCDLPPRKKTTEQGNIMKIFIAAALAAAQIALPAAPAVAASLEDESSMRAQQRGAFGGARVRIPFGGERSGKPTAGVAFSSVRQDHYDDGATRIRYSEGIELGLTSGDQLALSIAGIPLSQRLAAAEERDTTGEKLLKGAAVVAIIGVAVVGGLVAAFLIACDGGRCQE